MTNLLDPQLAWFDTIEYGAAPMMSPPRDDHCDEHCGRTTTATTTSSGTNSAQYHSPTMVLDGMATPERKRPFNYQRSPSALWDACHSTPARHAHHYGPTMSSYGAITSSANENSLNSIRAQDANNAASPLQPSAALYTNFDLPWTPRRLQQFTDTPTMANSFYSVQQQSTLETHESAHLSSPRKTASQMEMPPPPPPVRNATALRLSVPKVENALEYTNANPAHVWNEARSIYDNRRASQADLPPQFRSLYNASTVGPFSVAPNVVIPATVSRVDIKVVKRLVCNKTVVRRIATLLNEKDAFSFAMASSTIYAALEPAWWLAAFPVQDNARSAWAYLWPNSQGRCHLCARWTRIVLHTPSESHVCLDCIQLPQFRVITFSAAQAEYKLGSRYVVALLALLPAVQDEAKVYFWTSHLEWLQAWSQAKAEEVSKKPAKKTVRKRKSTSQVAKDKTVGKANSKVKTKSNHAKSNTGSDVISPAQADQVSPVTTKETGKNDLATKVRISLRGRGKVSSSPRHATTSNPSSDVITNRGKDKVAAVAVRLTSEDAQADSDDEPLSAAGKRVAREASRAHSQSGTRIFVSGSGNSSGHDGSPLRSRIKSSSAALGGLVPIPAAPRFHRASAASHQNESPYKENNYGRGAHSVMSRTDVFDDAHWRDGAEDQHDHTCHGRKTTLTLMGRDEDASFATASSPQVSKHVAHSTSREPFYPTDSNLSMRTAS